MILLIVATLSVLHNAKVKQNQNEQVIEQGVQNDGDPIKEELIEDVKVEEPVKENEIKNTSRGGLERSNSNCHSGYKITSYYPNDSCGSSIKTGSGKTINDFDTMKIGSKSVYTYKGKIVAACATKELLKTGYSAKGAQNSQDKYYFKYYQEFKIVIDGKTYDAICLDSCGAAMWEGYYRIDIFVPSKDDTINRKNVTFYI